jgi:ribosomal protein S18 acetylase RimI-like enzyme
MMHEYYAFDGHPYDKCKARKALLALLREPSFGRTWTICAGDAPVGYLVLTFGYSLEFLGRDAFLDEFFLRPSHRGLGWGRQALDFAETEARAHGVQAIHLEVVRSNETAHSFYRKAGFRDRGHYLLSKRIIGPAE